MQRGAHEHNISAICVIVAYLSVYSNQINASPWATTNASRISINVSWEWNMEIYFSNNGLNTNESKDKIIHTPYLSSYRVW